MVVFLRGAVLALPALRVLFPLGAEAVREGVALPVPLAVFLVPAVAFGAAGRLLFADCPALCPVPLLLVGFFAVGFFLGSLIIKSFLFLQHRLKQPYDRDQQTLQGGK